MVSHVTLLYLHLKEILQILLNRIRSGEFDLADAYDIETMRTWEQPELENAVNDFLHKKLQRMNLSAF